MRVVQKDKNTDDIVAGILKNDKQTIVMIYKKYFSSIRKLVYGFNRLRIDAEDVFQEGLTRAVVNIRNGKFKGDSSFHSYFYAICRNICLKEINQTKLQTDLDTTPFQEESSDNEWELIRLLMEVRNKIDPQCRELVDLRFNINGLYEGSERLTPFEYIAARLHMRADNARQKFRRCMTRISNLFINDPRYKELMS